MSERQAVSAANSKRFDPQDRRARARELVLDTVVLQNELFERGDLTPYLKMLSTMSYQNSRNLLLLMARFPTATCLTAFRTWKKQMPDPMAMVLRTGQKGKGIELLVPFTDLSRKKMTWYAAMHFDISQVNAPYKPPASPYASASSNHLQLLLTALHTVLGEHYHISLQLADDPEDLEVLHATDSEGRILPGFFMIRPDLGEEEKLRWITTSLCRVSLQSFGIPSGYGNYLSLCAAHCLFHIWCVDSLSQLLPNPSLIQSVPQKERFLMLDALQRCVYLINHQIKGPYVDARNLDAEATKDLPF